MLTKARYGGNRFDLRTLLIHLTAWLQGKKVVVLKSDPALYARVLTSSVTKGTFLERLIAIPAWRPIHSIESEDGPLWEELASNCAQVLRDMNWQSALASSLNNFILTFKDSVLDAEHIANVTAQVMCSLLFKIELSPEDLKLFYQASLEWRKEIAVKGKANPKIKEDFCHRLAAIISGSSFAPGFAKHPEHPMRWLSVFAQPFIISPQININDIMVAIFGFIKNNTNLYEQLLTKLRSGDDQYLDSVILEAIRLKHPFPILERELSSEMDIEGKCCPQGTQVMMVLDQFQQEQLFSPERWFEKRSNNPYHPLPFGAGRRTCLGKPLAMAFMREMLKAMLLNFPLDKIQPERGHLYSGRNNDRQQSGSESWYQVRRFTQVLWQSFKLGHKAHDKKCPFAST